jgi:hypothetical protein
MQFSAYIFPSQTYDSKLIMLMALYMIYRYILYCILFAFISMYKLHIFIHKNSEKIHQFVDKLDLLNVREVYQYIYAFVGCCVPTVRIDTWLWFIKYSAAGFIFYKGITLLLKAVVIGLRLIWLRFWGSSMIFIYRGRGMEEIYWEVMGFGVVRIFHKAGEREGGWGICYTSYRKKNCIENLWQGERGSKLAFVTFSRHNSKLEKLPKCLSQLCTPRAHFN